MHEIDLASNKGVIKKVIRVGVNDGEDSIPLPGQEVVVEYEARLENGVVIDSSAIWKEKNKEENFKLIVGMGNVIDGYDMGLMSMRLGEKCDLFIQSKYAFGAEGRPPRIPPNAPVIFRVELL